MVLCAMGHNRGGDTEIGGVEGEESLDIWKYKARA